jgi:hypothetical protein
MEELLNKIKNKGPVKIIEGQPSDKDLLYDEKNDDLFTELQKLKVLDYAIKEVIKEKKGIDTNQMNESILNSFGGDFLSE